MVVKKGNGSSNNHTFIDVRHINRDKKLVEALEKVKSYYPLCHYEVYDNDMLVATSYLNENTWAGQKTLFISSVKINPAVSNEKYEDIFASLLNFYESAANGYDAILFEDSDLKLKSYFESLGFSAIRKLNNFSAKKDKIIKNIFLKDEKSLCENYTFKKLYLEDIYKYSSFQDTRPGWNTSNLSIVKNKFNTLLALEDKSETVYAVCVYDSRFGLISRISVHPLSRKQGFGSFILKEAIGRMDCEDIFVSDIIDDSQNSIDFLKNVGFDVAEIKYEMHKEINIQYAENR